MSTSTGAAGGADHSSDEEDLQIILKELKNTLADTLKADPEYDDDWFLFPFLKTHSFNVEKAAFSVRESIRWRKEVNFPRLAEKDYNQDIYREMPVYMDAKTREGIPVASTVTGGDVDHKGIIEKFGQERYIKFFRQFHAKADKLSTCLFKDKAANPPKLTKDTKTGIIMIADVGNYSLSQAKSLAVIQTWVESTQNYKRYLPGAFRAIYILNVNKIFAPVLKLMLPWMEGPCLDVHLYDDGDLSWKDEIFEQVLPSQLRIPFGGTKVDP